MNNDSGLEETEMVGSQRQSRLNLRGQDNGKEERRKIKTSRPRSTRSKGRKRNNDGLFANTLDMGINVNVTTSVEVTNSERNVEVIDVEKVKDLPLVDLTNESRSEVYVDLTRELPNCPGTSTDESSHDSSVICISPTIRGQSSQQKLNKGGLIMIAQGSERVSEVNSFSSEHPITCTICMDNYNQIKKGRRQLTSTTCGHVFCNTCINSALLAQAKCPTCRKKITKKQLHPLFL